MGTNSVEPIRDNAPIDDTLDLGVGSARWDDIYATNATDEGLDASNYALFILSTWWENEEGDIKEEATEGYTERTRLGIRYPELLSFISSAFEQRLTDIETRVTALEG